MSRALSSTNASASSPESLDDTFPELPCYLARPSSLIFTFFYALLVCVLLPVCVSVLYCGFHRWRLAGFSPVSHSDSFTYNIVLVELVGITGLFLHLAGIHRKDPHVLVLGFYPMTFSMNGQILLHILTCLERYLAVVHPVAYMRLRNDRGVRIRNAVNASVWVFTVFTVYLIIGLNLGVHMDLVKALLSLTIVSFCSLSVLWVLIRPSPGKQAEGRSGMDASKRRAFYTILIILGALLLRFVFSLIWVIHYRAGKAVDCVMMTCDIWFYLPGSLIQPLLFFNRAGMLGCCRGRPE